MIDCNPCSSGQCVSNSRLQVIRFRSLAIPINVGIITEFHRLNYIQKKLNRYAACSIKSGRWIGYIFINVLDLLVILFHVMDIEQNFPIIINPKSSYLVGNFWFYLPYFQSFESSLSRLLSKLPQIPQITVHKKLLIKSKVSIQIW